jgi:hypothetical protein
MVHNVKVKFAFSQEMHYIVHLPMILLLNLKNVAEIKAEIIHMEPKETLETT